MKKLNMYDMSKVYSFFLFCCLFVIVEVKAQSGINVLTPRATLDVTGLPNNTAKVDGIIPPRLTGEELKAKDASYGAEQNGALVYVTQPLALGTTSAKTINVLKEGYYAFDTGYGASGEWYNVFYNYPYVLAGSDGLDAVSTSTRLSSVSGSAPTLNLVSKTFTLEKKALVNFYYNVSVNQLRSNANTQLSDRRNKIYAVDLVWQNGGGVFTNNTVLVETGSRFLSGATVGAEGPLDIEGMRDVILPAGTYTVLLRARLNTGASDTVGISAIFGDQAFDTFDIIATPLKY